jgi:hypothetical protein
LANLAGRTGVAMGIDDSESPTRQEIIIDPVTGQYIGAGCGAESDRRRESGRCDRILLGHHCGRARDRGATD